MAFMDTPDGYQHRPGTEQPGIPIPDDPNSEALITTTWSGLCSLYLAHRLDQAPALTPKRHPEAPFYVIRGFLPIPAQAA